MRVPLVKPDLPPFEDLESGFREALATGRVTNFGPNVKAFEREAGEYVGAEAVTMPSGTTGLILTLQALGVGQGGKVIVPSFTFVASVQAILYAGAEPLFADVGEDLTLDIEDLGALLESHQDVSAVLPVHAFGLPCHVAAIEQAVAAAEERAGHRIPVVYDAAHAFGSRVGERRVGSFGTAEVFSLSATKVLVSIEGGMVTSGDASLLERLRRERNYGIESAYDAYWPGVNGKMSELHALVGLHNLHRLDALMAARQDLAVYYLDQLRSRTSMELIPAGEEMVHTYKDFTVLVPPAHAGERDEVIARLAAAEIECRKYFSPPGHRQRFFARFADRPLPRTDDAAARVITLPFFTTMSHGEVDYVVEAIANTEAALGWR